MCVDVCGFHFPRCPSCSTTAPPQTKVYVGNVEPHITTEMIKNIFEPFGQVVGAEMVQDPNNPGNVRFLRPVLIRSRRRGGTACHRFAPRISLLNH